MDWIKIEGECMLPNDDTCLYQVRHQDGKIPFDRMITLSEVRPLYLAKIIKLRTIEAKIIKENNRIKEYRF